MKRTLVISNACFSDSISNGRTLAGLFENADPEKLAQFFVYGAPDSEICDNYYQVADRDALRSLLLFRSCGGAVRRKEKRCCGRTETPVPLVKKKTPGKMLLRELVWLFGRWQGGNLWKWIDNFRPEIICLFLANNTFLIRLAIRAAERYGIPIIVYTTEAYYFMDYNYLSNRPSVFYAIYHRWLQSAYRRLSPFVRQGFFNSTLLRDRYEEEFRYPCCCAMNSSQIPYINHAGLKPGRKVIVSYLGGLGLNRHKALIEIAQVLQELDKNYTLDVYGASPRSAVEEELNACPAICYHGTISYAEVVETIHRSTLIVHAEWNDAVTNRDLKYAFSTKIADSVSSGTPFFVYADESLAGTAFLRENECAFIAGKKEMLKPVLTQALTDETLRQRVVEKAKATRDKYLTGNDVFLQAFAEE